MADDSKSSLFSSITPQQLLALITLISSTILLQFPPLESRREADHAEAAAAFNDDFQFAASHIEDPLSALKKLRLVSPAKTPFNPKEEVKVYSHWGFFSQHLVPVTKDMQVGKDRILLMCAVMRPGFDTLSVEQRQKARLATTQGLASLGYVPSAGRAMQCVRLEDIVSVNPQDYTMAWNLGTGTLDVPFEWFTPSISIGGIGGARKAYRKICVLWLDSTSLAGRGNGKQIDRLRRVLHALLTGHPRPVKENSLPEVDPRIVESCLLGPPDTPNLVNMLAEAETVQKEEQRWLAPLRMASPYATASAEGLLRNAGLEGPKGKETAEVKRLMEKLLRCPEGFLRMPLTDDVIAEALVEELKNRGVPFTTDDPAEGDIVLVSEFDTSYGRELPRSFLTAAGRDPSMLNQEGSRWHWTSFPRGLDGRYSAGEHREDEKNEKTAGTAEPRGTNQMDALRRLGAQLGELNRMRQAQGKPGVVALGVMGGDVFDKLLVMRAMRHELPETIFFTNNLDAWLWDAHELRSTRNLIVASPFDLRLRDRWQLGKAPFRDSYQTSVYAGVLCLAFGESAGGLGAEIRGIEGRREQARLFEIGHHGPVPLSSGTVAGGPHPERPGAPELRGILPVLAVMGLAFVLWWRCSQHWKPLTRWRGPERENFCRLAMNPAFGFIVPLVALYVAYWLWKDQAADGEPLILTGGVSSYFFFSMSSIAAVLSIYLAVKTLAILFKGEAFLKVTYFPGKQATAESADWRERLRPLFLAWKDEGLVSSRTVMGKAEKILNPYLLWSEFRRSGRWRFRLMRAGIISGLIFIGIWLAFDMAHEPPAPVRGEAATFLCQAAQWSSFAIFIFLGALIFDSLWLNRIFIDWFGKGESEWSVQQVRLEYIQDLSWSDRCDYTDLRLVADWTKDIGRLTALPFYSLAIMLLARLNYFDVWRWHLPVVVGFVLIIAMVMVGSYRIHSAAERLRNSTIQRLLESKSKLDDKSASNKLIEEIRRLSHGAFKPFLKQPVMEAFYWLISALSMTGLAQALSQLIG